MKQAILTRGLTKRYGETLAVNQVDLKVKHGQIFTLLGPNGAGKTTLIRILTTLLKPDRGTAIIMGHDLKKEPEKIREKIGVVRQFSGSDRFLTVWDVLDFYAKIYKVPSGERKKKIIESLKIVGLEEQKDKVVITLSGGQQRRLALARAFLHTPEILFLDEPTTGLDPAGKRVIWEQIQLLNKDLNATIFMTTHDMHEAELLSQHIAIMDKGKIIAEGSLEELKSLIRGGNVVEMSGKGFTERVLDELKSIPTVNEVTKVEWVDVEVPQIKVVAYAGGQVPAEYEHLKDDPYTLLVEIPLEFATNQEKIRAFVKELVEERKRQLLKEVGKTQRFRVYLDNVEHTLPHSLELLFQHHVSVDQVQVKAVTLEDVFLKLTGKTLGG